MIQKSRNYQCFYVILTLFGALMCISAIAQQSAATSVSVTEEHSGTVSANEIPLAVLKYGNAKRVLLSGKNMAFGFPFQCGADGTIFFPGNSFSPTGDLQVDSFAVYAVKPRDATFLERFDPQMSGLRKIFPRNGLAISDNRVVVLVDAVTAEEELNQPKKKRHPFLLFFDRNGSFLRASALDVPFIVAGIGLFESGDVLVVGSYILDKQQNWVVVGEDGHVERNLAPARDDSNDKPLEGKEFVSAIKGMAGMVEILPWRGHLLLLDLNTKHPIVELNERGILRTVQLQLPESLTLAQMIQSDGNSWKVAMMHTVQGDSADGAPGYLIDKVGEFDPNSGQLLRYVKAVDKTHYATSLACERSGVYFALSTDPNDGALQVDEATVTE